MQMCVMPLIGKADRRSQVLELYMDDFAVYQDLLLVTSELGTRELSRRFPGRCRSRPGSEADVRQIFLALAKAVASGSIVSRTQIAGRRREDSQRNLGAQYAFCR